MMLFAEGGGKHMTDDSAYQMLDDSAYHMPDGSAFSVSRREEEDEEEDSIYQDLSDSEDDWIYDSDGNIIRGAGTAYAKDYAKESFWELIRDWLDRLYLIIKKYFGKDQGPVAMQDLDFAARQGGQVAQIQASKAAVQITATSTTSVVPVKSTAAALAYSTQLQSAIHAMTVAAGEVAASSLAGGTTAAAATSATAVRQYFLQL